MHRTRTIATAAILTLGTVGTALAATGGGAAPTEPVEPLAAPSTTIAPPPTTLPSVDDLVVVELPDPEPLPESGGEDPPVAATDELVAPADPVDPDPGPDPGPGFPGADVHDVISGGGTPPPDPTGPGDILGELDDVDPLPAGLDLVAVPGPKPEPQPKPGILGPGSLATAPSCATQCIESGVAYPRGFGARLVVKTEVPAELFISAIADLDGDGEYEDTHFETTQGLVSSHAWNLDHLEPGTTYHAMVAATDEHGHTSHAWGEFTTLSQRDVFVEIGDMDLWGGPGNITKTRWYMEMTSGFQEVTPGQQGILIYKDLPRFLDYRFLVVRAWTEDVCEVWFPDGMPEQGVDGGSCMAWNSGAYEVDLDTIPAGKNSWTSTTVHLDVEDTAGQGGALPPGYGDPYWFDFEVPVTFHVTYS